MKLNLQVLLGGAVSRALRGVMAGAVTKLLAVPLLSHIPGLAQFISNPELHTWIVVGAVGLIMGLAKSLRDKGKLPGWVLL